MAENRSRENNANWRGGRSIASNGYVLIRVGTDHHLADVRGYAYEHRIEAEKKLGRRLRRGEQVHHRDHDKMNNDHDNLEVARDRRHHAEQHRTVQRQEPLRAPDEMNPLVACECGCGTRFRKYDASGRPRKFVSGHNGQRDPKTGRILRG